MHHTPMPTPDHTSDHEALEIPPWKPGQPQPEVLVYPVGRQPMMWAYTGGQWRSAVVVARHRIGRHVAYQVRLHYSSNGASYRIFRWGDGTLVPRERLLTDTEVQAYIDGPED